MTTPPGARRDTYKCTPAADLDRVRRSVNPEAELVWDEALRWVRQWAEATSPEKAIEHIDRAEPFNPYRAAGAEGGERG